ATTDARQPGRLDRWGRGRGREGPHFDRGEQVGPRRERAVPRDRRGGICEGVPCRVLYDVGEDGRARGGRLPPGRSPRRRTTAPACIDLGDGARTVPSFL